MKRIVLFSVFFMVMLAQAGAQDTTRISLLFLGDIMQHDSQIQAAWKADTKRYDYSECFQFIKPFIREADLAIGNLELTLAGPPFKGYPQFSAPDNLAFTLRDVGMDALVTANNHSVDRGKQGIERTLDMLDSLGIPHTGTFRDTVERMNESPLMLYKNGFRIALLNYTYGTNGIRVPRPTIVNPIDTALIRKDMQAAKMQSPDAIIVFVHWGLEYQRQPSADQRRVAAFCFRQGATLVIGSHPHVLQPMEWDTTANHAVVYSLGNFVSGQRDRYKNGGAMMRVELMKTGNDSVSTTRLTDVRYVLEWVYRTADAQRDYYVLPVPTFERDSLHVIQDAISRAAFTEFARDSRELFARYNKNVSERTAIPGNEIRYKVLYYVAPPGEQAPPISGFYGLEQVTFADGHTCWYSGNFTTEAEASRHALTLGLPDVRIVRFINGREEE